MGNKNGNSKLDSNNRSSPRSIREHCRSTPPAVSISYPAASSIVGDDKPDKGGLNHAVVEAQAEFLQLE